MGIRTSNIDRRTLRDAVAIGLATGAYGASYGAIAVASGLTVGQASFLSLFAFTGASQFALIGVVGAGGSAVAAVAAALLLGGRNTLYAVRMRPVLGLRGFWPRTLGAHMVIDESVAMTVAQEDRALARQAFWLTGISIFVCWNVATVIGAFAGDLVADPAALGLDAAFPAAFLALLGPRLRERPALLAAVAGAAVALAATPFLPAGVPVLLAVVPAMVIAERVRRAGR